ncbi:MAG: S1C family serine protease [Solirubrobacteraceae bacterium]
MDIGILEELEGRIQQAACSVGPAVVGLGRGWGVGSGVVIGESRVLTNAHNLRHDEVAITFGDGRREAGRVAASDTDLDLAVISVDTAGIEPPAWALGAGVDGSPAGAAGGEDPAGHDASANGDTGELPAVGRFVIALGNPGGRGLRVTPGFVSGAARSFRGPRGRRIAGAIEHTAPLPRGSSGGPLLDGDGRLLGINTVRVDGGLILAITLDGAMRDRIEALGRGEAPKRARLGVVIVPPRAARRLRHAVGLPERDGILIRSVEDGGPAERAGLQRGDLIVAAAGVPIDSTDALYESLDAATSSGKIELAVLRSNEERTVTVTFSE